MEMEDHSQHSHYPAIDLRHFIAGRPTHHFPSIPPPPPPPQSDLFRNLHPSQDHPYHDMMMLMPRGGGGLHEFRSDHSSANSGVVAVCDNSGGSNTVVASAPPNTVLGGLDGDAGCSFGGDGGTGRWPRQETLTLLEIRSRLDSKFKEANQKGPLWDEVSRIMSEEHGYQRSGKKCREKFENLYKYYKKTKEGKAGRQDGKHYRFFRQLEALYGDSSNVNQASVPETQYGAGITSLRFHSEANATGQVQETTVHSQKLCDSLSLSNSSEFDISSSEDNDLSTATLQENNDSTEKRRKRRGGWKAKIKDFIDSQMKKLIERQEAWLDKLTKTLEQKEQERIVREEEWRKQEAARIDREHKFWAKERAWIEARDSALMEALKKLSGREAINDLTSTEELMGGGEISTRNESRNEDENEATINGEKGSDGWQEAEITRLVQIRSSMESKFQQRGDEEVLWDDIATKLACLGYEKSALMCKEKWDRINNRVLMRKTNKEGNKKRKENSRQSCYNVNFESNESAMYNNQGGGYCDQMNQQSPPPQNSNAAANSVGESCFRYFMGEGESLWENYGLKLNSGDQNQ